MVDTKYDDVDRDIIAFAIHLPEKVCIINSRFPARQLFDYLLMLCLNEIVAFHFSYVWLAMKKQSTIYDDSQSKNKTTHKDNTANLLFCHQHCLVQPGQ